MVKSESRKGSVSLQFEVVMGLYDFSLKS